MAYSMHEMNVILFSKEDTVFGDTITSPQDNEYEDNYEDDDDNPISTFSRSASDS